MAITSINGVPFYWNEKENEELIKSFFPHVATSLNKNANTFGKKSKGHRSKRYKNASPLADIRLHNRSIEEIADIYYPKAEVLFDKAVTFIKDIDCECETNTLKEITNLDMFFYDHGNNGKFDTSDKFAFNIYLVIDTDALKLDEAYTCLDPDKYDPDGVYLFLEDNTGDLSGAYLKAKIGSNVKNNLDKAEHLYGAKVMKHIQEKFSIDELILKELLEKGYVESLPMSMLSFFANLSFIRGYIVGPASKGLAKLTGNLMQFLSDEAKIKDRHWNPDAEDKENPNAMFKPFFFPQFTEEELNKLNDKELNEKVQNAVADFEKWFRENDTKMEAFLKQDIGKFGTISLFGTVIEGDVLPDFAEDFIKMFCVKLRQVLLYLIEKLKAFDFSQLISKGINMINAYLCGMWNGMIEAIIGLLALAQMIFYAIGGISDLSKDFSGTLQMFMEHIDALVDAFKAINFKEIFTAIWDGITGLNVTDFSLEQIAYFGGAAVGFIIGLVIEIVIGLIISGGAITIAIIAEKLVATITGMLTIVPNLLKGTADFALNVAKGTTKKLRGGLKAILELLQKDPDFLKKLIQEFFAKLNKNYQAAKALIGFGLDLETKVVFERLGLEVKIYSRESGKMMSTLIPVTPIEGDLFAVFHKGVKIAQGSSDDMTALRRQIQKMKPKRQTEYLDQLLARTKGTSKIMDDFVGLREKYKAMDIPALWKQFVKEPGISLSDLRKLYKKRVHKFPGLQNFHNQAEFKTIIKNLGKEVETVKEYFISGKNSTIIENFGSPPKLPNDLTDVLDDYEDYVKFARDAVDTKNKSRRFDSELKYVFNFLKKHLHKGDEFVVEISSLIKVCESCSRELMMLQEILAQQGKTIKFVVKHDETLVDFKAVLDKIK